MIINSTKINKFKSIKKDTFVRMIDNKSYWFFIMIYILGIFISAIIYYILLQFSDGLIYTYTAVPEETIDFLDTLYFSTVTITSLGYGDYRPIGFGKFIATLEVLYGLIILAIFVSKLASERTSTLVRLIYTSDIENRIRERTSDFYNNTSKLKNAMDTHNYKEIFSLVKILTRDYSTNISFFSHHLKAGHLDGRWAEKLYLKLLKSIEESVKIVAITSKLENLTQHETNSCKKSLNQALILSDLINNHFKYNRITNLYKNIKQETDQNILAKRRSTVLSQINNEIINTIKDLLPTEKPWKKDIHKDIAKELRLSNSMVSKVINIILENEKKLTVKDKKKICHCIYSKNSLHRKVYNRELKKYC